jgi:hypothetical protein
MFTINNSKLIIIENPTSISYSIEIEAEMTHEGKTIKYLDWPVSYDVNKEDFSLLGLSEKELEELTIEEKREQRKAIILKILDYV